MEHRCLSPWKGAVAGGLLAFACSPAAWANPAPALAARLVAAFCWTWVLGKIPGLTLKDAALYGLFFGLSAGVLDAPLDPWRAADGAVSWTIASLAISRCWARVCELPPAA